LLEEAEKLETALRTRIEQLGRARAKAISSIAAENEKRWQEMDTSKQEQIVADVLKAIAPAEEAGDDRAGAFNRESKLRIALFAVAAVPRDDARLDQALRATISRYGLRERYAPPGASQVWGVAFSPNKNVLQAAIGDDIGIVRLWKPLASDPARELSTGSGVVNGVAFSPDGSLFAAANRSFGAVVWKLDEDNPRCKLTGNGGAFSVAFAPGNKLLAVASSDRTVRLWELPQEAGAKCRQVGEPLPHSDQVFGVAFSPDGRLLATASGDGMVSVWSLDEATIGPASKPFRQFPDNPKRPGEPMFAVQFSSTGKQLLVASAADGQGYIWDIETGQQTELPTQKGTLGQTAFSPNGEFVVATASDDGAAIVSNPSTGETVARFGGNPLAPPMRRKLFGVAFSPDSKYLLTGNLDGVARLWAMGANEVPAVGRDELIRLGRQLIGDSEMALSPGPECEALRKLGVPIFTFADKPWDETSKAILCPLPFLEPQAKAN
jgi:DNA-binding beta-propeller fold protein YncE